ncbi:hypothetical protein CESP606_08420 [Cereibacter sphaeroides]
MGRLLYHTNEVRARRRAFFGREFLWEIPALVLMTFVGEALSSSLNLDRRAAMGLVAMLAYLGPRGTKAMAERLWRGLCCTSRLMIGTPLSPDIPIL